MIFKRMWNKKSICRTTKALSQGPLIVLLLLLFQFFIIISFFIPSHISTLDLNNIYFNRPSNAIIITVSAHTGSNIRINTNEFTYSKTNINFIGWDASPVKLENNGIIPSVVLMGRYLLIIGGTDIISYNITTWEFLNIYALSSINVFDITSGVLVKPLMLVHNDTSTEHIILNNNNNNNNNKDEPIPLPPRVPALLTFPAVGTANTVRLGLAAYIIGFCTTIPNHVNVVSGPEFNIFLRSIQEIRLFQEQFPPVYDITMSIRNISLPETATLRYNASCVGNGHDIIYILGGVSVDTGASLGSVSQYNVLTGQFIDAGWILPVPLIAPGVLESSDLVYLAGGYIRDSNNNNIIVQNSLFVIDPASYIGLIGNYNTDWPLNWLSPHLFINNHTLSVMGATNDRSFNQQMVWPDILKETWAGPESISIPFAPLRSQAGLAGVIRNSDNNNNNMEIYLVGGQIPAPEGNGVSSNVFIGKMYVEDGRICVGVVGFHYSALAEEKTHELMMRREISEDWMEEEMELQNNDNNINNNKYQEEEKEEEEKEEKQQVNKEKEISINENSSSSISSNDNDNSEDSTTITTITSTPEISTTKTYSITPSISSTMTITPTISLSITPSISETILPPKPIPPPPPPPKDLPNNDGNITILVNGYEPLWYNFTFNILLTENAMQACPQIMEPNNNNNNNNIQETTKISPCLLRLSLSPACNSPILDMGNLTSDNTEYYTVEVVDPDTNVTSTKKYTSVGPITLTGSLLHGIHNITSSKQHPSGLSETFSFTKKYIQTIFGNETTRPFYQQIFMYVCFSDGAHTLPQCGDNNNNNNNHHHYLSKNKNKFKKSQCVSAFYRPLNADRPFVLSPVTNWVPDIPTTTIPPEPTPDNSIPSSTIIVLVVFIIIALVCILFFIFRMLRKRLIKKRFQEKEEERQGLLANHNKGYYYNDYDEYEYEYDDDDEEERSRGVGRGAAIPAHQKKNLLDGKYRVLHRLGKGSFSVVYLVESISDKQRFALKYVQCADDVDRIEAMRECEVAYTLQGHPNVIRLVDMFMSYRFDTNLQRTNNNNNNKREIQQSKQTDIIDNWSSPGDSFIVRVDSESEAEVAIRQRAAARVTSGERYLSLVMEYHEKGDLGKWIRQQKSEPMISEATIVSIAFQILSVLQFMHSHNPPIIHRDLKPENILLDSFAASNTRRKGNHNMNSDINNNTNNNNNNNNTQTLRVVVTDFGLSRVMDKTFCETGVGSLPYVAPECWQRHYSTKVDIWATGCILYAACAKRVESDNVKVMFSECNRPDFKKRLIDELTQVYGYSMALAVFIVYLLEPDPTRRPSAEEALRLIRKRKRDAIGASDAAMMVSLYKEEENNNNDNNNNMQSGKINRKGSFLTERKVPSTEEALVYNNNNNNNNMGNKNVVSVGPANSNLRVESDISSRPIIDSNKSTLQTGSFDHHSSTPSRKSQQQQQEGNNSNNISREIIDGSLHMKEVMENKNSPTKKRQMRLQRVEKYFETIANETEECDFFIARESPSLVPVTNNFITTNTSVINRGDRTPPPPIIVATTSSSLNNNNLFNNNNNNNNNNTVSKLNIQGKLEVGSRMNTSGMDSLSMTVLPSLKGNEEEGNTNHNNKKKKKRRNNIILKCDDGSEIIKESTTSSSSSNSPSSSLK